MTDLLCGPSTCGISGWFYDFQTLLTGILAILAALVAIGGQVWLHHKNERDRQIDRSNAIIFELVSFGGQIGVLLDKIAKRRDERKPDVLEQIDTDETRKLIEQCYEMLDEVRSWLPGPDGLLMSQVSWRLINLRSNLNLATSVLRLIEIERQTGKSVLTSSDPVYSIANDIKRASETEMPDRLVSEYRRLHGPRWRRWLERAFSRATPASSR